MRTTQWFDLNPTQLNRTRDVTIRGVNAKVAMSPYDVPRALRAVFDDSGDLRRVEVRYIEPDEPRVQVHLDGLVAELGKHSRRFYSLTFPSTLNRHTHNFDKEIEETLKQGFSVLESKSEASVLRPEKENYRAASEAIQMNRKKLLEGAPA